MDRLGISGTLKYLNLKKVLKGPAEQYVGHLNQDDDNSFDAAVKALKTYFGKTTTELARLFQRLLDTPDCKDTQEGRVQFHGAVIRHMTRLQTLKNVTVDQAFFALHLSVWERRMGNTFLSYWLKFKSKKSDDDHPLGADVTFEDLDNVLQRCIKEKRDFKAATGTTTASNDKDRKPYFGQQRKFPFQQQPYGGKGNPPKVLATSGNTGPATTTKNPSKKQPATVMAVVNPQGKKKDSVIQTPCPWCQQGAVTEKRQEFQHPFPLNCPKLKGTGAIPEPKIVAKILRDRLCRLCTARGHTAATCPATGKLKCSVCGAGDHCRYLHSHLKGDEPPPPYGSRNH